MTAHIPSDIGKRADQQGDNNVRIAGRADERGNDDGSWVYEDAGNQRNNADIGCIAGEDGRRSNRHNPTADDENRGSKGPRDDASAAEMVILIPPVVFDGQPTTVMPAMNYDLARQMADDGISNIDVDFISGTISLLCRTPLTALPADLLSH